MAEESYEVFIEGKAHPWDKDTISVADIRQLGGMSADVPVVEEDLRTGAERTMSEDEIIQPTKLDPGKRAAKRFNHRRASG